MSTKPFTRVVPLALAGLALTACAEGVDQDVFGAAAGTGGPASAPASSPNREPDATDAGLTPQVDAAPVEPDARAPEDEAAPGAPEPACAAPIGL